MKPDEPLSLTVHSLPAPGPQDVRRRTLSGRLKMLLVLLACAAPVLASYFTYYVIRPEGRSNYGTLVQPTRTMPPGLSLRTLEGQAVDPKSLRNQWLLVVVGGGSCDAACAQRLYMQRQLRQMLGKERERLDKVWLITDDAPLAPELRASLAGLEPVQALHHENAPGDERGMRSWDHVAVLLQLLQHFGNVQHVACFDPEVEFLDDRLCKQFDECRGIGQCRDFDAADQVRSKPGHHAKVFAHQF